MNRDRLHTEHVSMLVVTALSLEFLAVERHLRDVTEEIGPTKSVYRVGRLGTGSTAVSVVQAGPGNLTAAIETERAIQFFGPSYVFFVGVAGGIKDVRLGDVVAATKVYAYESGKSEKEFLPRPEALLSGHALLQRAMSVARDSKWASWLEVQATDEKRADESTDPPRALVGAIAAGEKVVASKRSTAYKLLRTSYSDALAIEMEGFGALRAAFAHPGVEAIVIRGISDLVEGKRQSDHRGWQPRAAAHAAAFLAEMISGLATTGASRHTPEDSGYEKSRLGRQGVQHERAPDLFRVLLDAATELYPTGPAERDVWTRAGGDLSRIELAVAGRTAWQRAIRLVMQGGGGTAITVGSLTRAMYEDFSNNQTVLQLHREHSRSE